MSLQDEIWTSSRVGLQAMMARRDYFMTSISIFCAIVNVAPIVVNDNFGVQLDQWRQTLVKTDDRVSLFFGPWKWFQVSNFLALH